VSSADLPRAEGGAFSVTDGTFIEQLHAALAERKADGQGLALLVVHFGLVGRADAHYGYEIGDAVRARLIATVRNDVLRPGDFLGEFGRDQVACVLAPLADPQMALMAADKLRRALHEPLWLGEDEVYASPAIGIATHSGDIDDARALMRQARTACVTAAELPDRIALYDVAQDGSAALLVREGRLRSAVVGDALEIVFQPQFDLRFGQIMGMESLLRWPDGTRELVPMQDAIQAAEAIGIVDRLLSSLLNRALRNCAEFRQRAGLDLRVAVNLPARALLMNDLPELVERALRTWGLRAGRLMLEIEGIPLLQARAEARATLQKLYEMGVKLSIDDTGAPGSSLFFIATMPFHEMKIDLSGVTNLPQVETAEGETLPRSGMVLKSLANLAHQLGLEVTVIGVPNETVAGQLAALGCDFMQGDYRAAPADPEEFVRLYYA
jgi:predicted signal transduction protein with EAL and GGDEF domain